MNIFAHNGVDHATSAEAIIHSLGDVLFITLAITILAISLMTAATYTLHRLGWIELPVKERGGKK